MFLTLNVSSRSLDTQCQYYGVPLGPSRFFFSVISTCENTKVRRGNYEDENAKNTKYFQVNNYMY